MILATIQPSFLPWLGYLEQMAVADLFVSLDDVQYTKQDWRNRNRILNDEGEAEYITVPVKAGAEHLSIRHVEIATDPAWRRRMINKLATCYRQAPFASRYLRAVTDILSSDYRRLADLNAALMEFLRGAYDITTPLALASDAGIATTDKNQRLIDLCVHHGATVLYDGAAASTFIDVALFRAAGVEVIFQHYSPQPYAQGRHAFVSHLSALDALMWCGDDARRILRASPVPPAIEERR